MYKPTTHILPGGRGLEIKYSSPENIEPKQSTNTGATSNGGSTTISIPVLYAGFDFCTTVGVEELTQVRKRVTGTCYITMSKHRTKSNTYFFSVFFSVFFSIHLLPTTIATQHTTTNTQQTHNKQHTTNTQTHNNTNKQHTVGRYYGPGRWRGGDDGGDV